MKILSFLKKVSRFLNKIFVYILLTPAYFLIIGISRMFKAKERKEKKSFWKETTSLNEIAFNSPY